MWTHHKGTKLGINDSTRVRSHLSSKSLICQQHFWSIFAARKRSLGHDNVFTGVCHSSQVRWPGVCHGGGVRQTQPRHMGNCHLGIRPTCILLECILVHLCRTRWDCIQPLFDNKNGLLWGKMWTNLQNSDSCTRSLFDMVALCVYQTKDTQSTFLSYLRHTRVDTSSHCACLIRAHVSYMTPEDISVFS